MTESSFPINNPRSLTNTSTVLHLIRQTYKMSIAWELSTKKLRICPFLLSLVIILEDHTTPIFCKKITIWNEIMEFKCPISDLPKISWDTQCRKFFICKTASYFCNEVPSGFIRIKYFLYLNDTKYEEAEAGVTWSQLPIITAVIQEQRLRQQKLNYCFRWHLGRTFFNCVFQGLDKFRSSFILTAEGICSCLPL